MRSSKSRSRSKANRPRTLGNIINRVFDSSGPEGKVRGTPQQIIEKYQTLARDAQLSNDRVAAENFLQHAEHYTRLLAEAMREMAAEQEARGQNFTQNNGQNGGQNGWQNRGQDGRADGGRSDGGEGDQPYGVAHDVGDGEAALVDLPEQDRAPQPQRQFQPRPDRQNDNRQNDNRQNSGRQNDNRQNNRPQIERPQNERPRDDRPREAATREVAPREVAPREVAPREVATREDTPREERHQQNERPRDDRRENRRVAPAPQLRFEDGTADERPVAAPVFESPAAVVAQIVEMSAPEPAPAPKPRAPRAKKSVAPAAPEGQLDV